MVDPQNNEIRTDEERVSGGSKEGVVRWVLGIGLVLAVIAMSMVWIVPALTQSGEEDVSSRVAPPQTEAEPNDDSTDSIIESDDIGTGAVEGTGDGEEPAAE